MDGMFLLLEALLLSGDMDRSHYNTDFYIRKLPLEQQEWMDYNDAWSKYLTAKSEYFDKQSNKTFMLLIGYFTRWNKLVTDFDDKYGARK